MPIAFDRADKLAVPLFAVVVFIAGVIVHEAGHCAAIIGITSEMCRPHFIYIAPPQMLLSPGEDLVIAAAGPLADLLVIGFLSGMLVFAPNRWRGRLSFAVGVLVLSAAYSIAAYAFNVPGRPVDPSTWTHDYRRMALDITSSRNLTSFRGARDTLVDIAELATLVLATFAVVWVFVEVRMNRGVRLLARAGGMAFVAAVCLTLLTLVSGSPH